MDGIDLRFADPFEVRKRIGIVPQDTVLFADNVLENIRYGNSEACDEDVHAAAKRVLRIEHSVTGHLLPEEAAARESGTSP